MGLLEQLSPSMKLNLIERLRESVKSQITSSKMKVSFGAWSPNESAEELSNTIRSSRSTNRNIEEL